MDTNKLERIIEGLKVGKLVIITTGNASRGVKISRPFYFGGLYKDTKIILVHNTRIDSDAGFTYYTDDKTFHLNEILKFSYIT